MINLKHIADDQPVMFPITRGHTLEDDGGWDLEIFSTFGNYPIEYEWGEWQEGMPEPEDMISYDGRYAFAILKGLDQVPVGSYEYRITVIATGEIRAVGCLTIGDYQGDVIEHDETITYEQYS